MRLERLVAEKDAKQYLGGIGKCMPNGKGGVTSDDSYEAWVAENKDGREVHVINEEKAAPPPLEKIGIVVTSTSDSGMAKILEDTGVSLGRLGRRLPNGLRYELGTFCGLQPRKTLKIQLPGAKAGETVDVVIGRYRLKEAPKTPQDLIRHLEVEAIAHITTANTVYTSGYLKEESEPVTSYANTLTELVNP